MTKTNKKWYTIVEYVDINTGEVLLKSEWERNDYYIVKQEEKVKYKKSHNEKIIKKLGRKKGQLRLF